MKKGILFFTGMTAFFLTQTFADEVYYWKDKNGVTHFSDAPPAEQKTQSRQIDIINPSVPALPIPQQNVVTPTQAEPKSPEYTLTITSPINQETIRSNEGKINVSVNIAPETPQNGEVMQLLVDEKRFACDVETGSCQAFEIDRGAHQLKTELFNKNGNVISSSNTVSVYLFKTTQLNRQLRRQ